MRANAKKKKMTELILTPVEVRSRLRALQLKYGATNKQFRVDLDVRRRVSDEDEFEWEAYLAHEEAIREREEEEHRRYLSRVVSAPRDAKAKDRDTVQPELAA
ncbi:MAG: hypothetical protein ABSA78_18445 [Candidatus Sulfotelmatobacter sp.]|jgi:hypothetical protein